ncbi:MAG: hypothetical protein ACR2KG_08000 [Nocardioidaceae bacterium]
MSLHDLWWSLYDWTRDLSSSQRILRGLMIVSSLFSLASVRLAGFQLGFGPAAVVIALTVLVIFRSQSHASLALIAAIAWTWYRSVGDPTTPWVLVVALGVLVIHASCALAATAPTSAGFEAASWLAWARSAAAVAAATVAVWLLSVGLRQVHSQVGVALVVVTLLSVAALALALRGHNLAAESDQPE